MTDSSSDPQLQLKKRARRRLVGAVAFAGLAAVVLPMVMDEEPKPPAHKVQIRIPNQEQPPFIPKEPGGKPLVVAQGVPLSSERPEAVAGAQEAAATKMLPAVPTNGKPVQTVPANNKVVPPAKPADKPQEKKVVKPADRGADATEKKAGRPAEKGTESKPAAAVKKNDKAVEKTAEKPAAKKVEKSGSDSARQASKSGEKKAPEQTAADKTSEKVPEKPTDKATEKPAEKPVEGKSADEAAKTNDDAPRAATASPATSKPASTSAPPASKGGTTQHVIVIGAFSNPDNAKQVQGKIGGLGVNTYTEVLTLPDGTKTRVRAGPFPTREAAEKALEKLRSNGVNGVVASRQ